MDYNPADLLTEVLSIEKVKHFISELRLMQV